MPRPRRESRIRKRDASMQGTILKVSAKTTVGRVLTGRGICKQRLASETITKNIQWCHSQTEEATCTSVDAPKRYGSQHNDKSCVNTRHQTNENKRCVPCWDSTNDDHREYSRLLYYNRLCCLWTSFPADHFITTQSFSGVLNSPSRML